MTWNRVIERANQEVSFRLGNRSHNHTKNNAIILNIIMIVSDDGIPQFWCVEGKQIEPRSQAMELLKDFLT